MYIISYIKIVYDYVLNIRRCFKMKNNRRQAQFLLRSITDDVPQLLLEENNLVFRNELKKDILIPCSSVISIKILPINRIYNPSVGLLKDGMKGFMAHRNVGVFSIFLEIIYVFLTIFLYLLKCPQSLILSALRAFFFCGKPHISRSIFLYFRYQAWLKSW